MQLDEILGLAAGAVDCRVEGFGRVVEGGDDVTRIEAAGRGFQSGDDAAS